MLKLYNTLTRKKEIFKPLNDKQVNIYTCGLTVYSEGHIGNFRSFVFADILRRYLKYKGYKVKQVRNITDVDDKTIRDSQREGISLKKFTEKYTRIFHNDAKTLNLEMVEYEPKATEHIEEMVKIVKKLLRDGYAYKEKDGIYFDISKFKDYGKFARLKIKDLKAKVRIKNDEYEKQDVNDFALWKFYDKEDGEVFWDTEIGKGRPGWHVECSAMSMKYLGKTLDIHTGGADLVFPHHQNEIAQSEAYTEKQFVRYWLHNGWLLVEGKKMSKSLGNFYTIDDITKKGYDARTIRYVLLSSQYRQPLNFTFRSLGAAKQSIKRLDEFILKSKNKKDSDRIIKIIDKAKKNFEKSLDDDLDMPKALAVIFNFIRNSNKVGAGKKAYSFLLEADKVLGLELNKVKETQINKEIQDLLQKREKARKNKDFEKADRIREKIQEKGYIVEDSESGPIVKKREIFLKRIC